MTTDAALPSLSHEQLEDRFMAAAEGDAAAVDALTQALTGDNGTMFADWPEDTRDAWTAGAELFLESVGDTETAAPEACELVHALARIGFESRDFRDVLASVIRHVFAAYPDRATLLNALGVPDKSVPSTRIARRWEAFAALEEGRACCHAAHGAGTITHVDGLSNEVEVAFAVARSLPLAHAVDALVVVKPKSFIEELRNNPARWDSSMAWQEFVQQSSASLMPPTDARGILQKLVVPDVMSAAAFRSLRQHKQPATASPSAPAEEGEEQRPLADARSIEELRDLLRETHHEDLADRDRDTVDKLLRGAAERPDQAEETAEIIARVWKTFAKQRDWLAGRLSELEQTPVTMARPDLFVPTTESVSGKLIPAWFGAACSTLGAEKFAERVVDLPLRFWNQAERALQKTEAGAQLLVEKACGKLKSGEGSADAFLWLWRKKPPEVEALRDPNLVLRTLANNVKGSFLKAARELRRLVIRDPDLQRFLLHDGENEDGAAVFVRAVKHTPVLDNGERQSLLVRIVRLFPEYKSLVESRSAPTRRKASQRITSPRSYERQRRELEIIIKEKIPANSRAIAHARSYGDLRENAEYKAAKEEQAYLTSRREELENALHEVRATLFEQKDAPSQVVPGYTVRLAYADGTDAAYHVLGLWDSDPQHNMISYDTPLGSELLGKKQGEAVTTPTGKEAEVAAIMPLPEDLAAWLNTVPDDEE